MCVCVCVCVCVCEIRNSRYGQDHSKIEFGDKKNLETVQYLKNYIYPRHAVFTGFLQKHCTIILSQKVGVNDLDFRQKSKAKPPF